MTYEEIIKQLEVLGQASIKKTLMRHGIKEPLFGVKVEDLKKIFKVVKYNHSLSLQLYNSGIYDAMYLAGIIAEPEKMSINELQDWVEKANAPILCGSTVAAVTAESKFGMQLATKWIEANEEGIACCGWATLADIVSIKEDSELDIEFLKELLEKIPKIINSSPNRVRYNMNVFIIAVGSYVKPLNDFAKEIAAKIGKVEVDMGDTACKIPLATEYIEKVEKKNGIGKKKKTARC